MAEKFGQTWWGNAWLQSLTHIDFANRIPRGARYARNGFVKDLKIKGNTIKAKVQGSRLTPYSVTITIPGFDEAKKDKFIKALTSHPAIVANLLNRKLDAEVLDVAQKCGIMIFPSRWSDLEMKCSCPDWAVPCKHIAAVIYMVSKEIDNNPFLVFEMHGLDILAELSSHGLNMGKARENVDVPLLDDALGFSKKPTIKDLPENINRLDFSRLEDRSGVLLRLLPDQPSFYSKGNFKDVYATTLHSVQRKVASLMFGKLDPREIFEREAQSTTLTLDTKINISLGDTNPDTFIVPLLSIDPDFLMDYDPSVIANHQALYAAMHLLSIGAVAPCIFRSRKGYCSVLWQPAEIDKQVRDILEKLSEIVPGDIVTLSRDRAGMLYPRNPARMLVTRYLDRLIHGLTKEYNDDDVCLLFFKDGASSFDSIGHKEIPGAIKSWLDHLQVTKSRWQPVFNISEAETEDEFHLELAVCDREKPEALPTPLSKVLGQKKFEAERIEMLRPFSLLSVLMPEVNACIDKKAKKPIVYDFNTFVPFLLEVVPTIQMLDIKVFMPKSLSTLLRPKPTVRVTTRSSGKPSFGINDLFQFSWEVSIGDNILTYEEFKDMMYLSKDLLRFKGQYVYVSPDDLLRIHGAFRKRKTLSDARLMQAVLSGEYESAPVVLDEQTKKLIDDLSRQETIPVPKTLEATLRPYQERGYSWLYKNMRIGFGSILADDMGLGKTLQTISLILKLKEEGALEEKHALIVAPTGLLTNWQAEVNRFAPGLKCEVYHGNSRSLKDFSSDILLTTYGMVRSDAADLKKLPWRVMVIDEAQNIKNNSTLQTRAITSIDADTHIALSGTPVENRLSEFWSIMNFTNKGYLDSLKDFNERFAKPIQQNGDTACAERFRRITAPFMMRRMKTDKNIISDLPDKIEMNEYVSLTPQQAALYQATLESAMEVIEGMPSSGSGKDLFERQGAILQMILALKQICNHPAQYLKNGDVRPELSGKVEMLLDTVQSIIDVGEKVLIFTQFREMGDLLVKFIAEKSGQAPLFLHGGCSVKKRAEMVNRFQNGRQDKVFVLSLKAAGTGLNLTAATNVIHFDLWWNPAVEAQATDRAFRIGQSRNVMVHRFITKGTFEEKIDRMISDKKHLAEMTVASGESWIGKLSNKELRELFS